MTIPSGKNVPVPDPAQVKCAEVLDKLLALSTGGASGELPLVAAADLANDLASELAVYDARAKAAAVR